MFCFGFWFKISAVFDWPSTHNMQQGTDFLVLSPCSQNDLICDLTEWTAVIHGHYSEESSLLIEVHFHCFQLKMNKVMIPL